MSRHIVLLRGINLGAKRRVSMPDLRELLGGLGYEGVRTHLQSGNVALTSKASPARLTGTLEQQLAESLGFDVDVVVRTRDELAAVVDRDPLGDVASDPKRYQVSFLSAKLAPGVAKQLTDADVAPERVVVSGREIYAWHPNGIQRSPLAKLLTAERLGVTATARNWNTVVKLLALADE
jgi:uncharacterized protein (DUF1697 family)